MRKRQTFLLTVLTADNGSSSLCGQLKVIASGNIFNFTNQDELYRLITTEMGEDVLQRFSRIDLSGDCSAKPFEPQ